MIDERLSENFWLHEFVQSQLAERYGIDNTPSLQVMDNLVLLCRNLLEPVRAALGRAMVIDSGYRCPELNQLAKGSAHSAHMQGCAADVKVMGMSPLAVCQKLQLTQWPYLDQCIMEGSWTHLAVAQPGILARREYLTAAFGPNGATYTQGVHA